MSTTQRIVGGIPMPSVSYWPDPAMARREYERAYGSGWWRWHEVRYSDPLDWSPDVERWHHDPLYRRAIEVVIGWLAWCGLGVLRFSAPR